MGTFHEFPASAASSLVEGYCDDFIQLAASLAQTLEQVSMRGLSLDKSRESLVRVERGMRSLADAIGAMLHSGNLPAIPGHVAQRKARPAAKNILIPDDPPPEPKARAPVRETPAQRTARLKKDGGLRGDCTIQGNTESMPIASVFQFLSRMHKSGSLRVVMDDEQLIFEFVDGCVEFASSNLSVREERLGQILAEKGFARRQDIEPVIERYREFPRKLGSALVHEGLVTDGQLVEALETQVQRRFHRAFRAKRANYEFHEGDRVPGDGRIRIKAMELLFESRRASGT